MQDTKLPGVCLRWMRQANSQAATIREQEGLGKRKGAGGGGAMTQKRSCSSAPFASPIVESSSTRDGAVQRQLQKLESWSAALPPVLCNKMSLVECLDACVSRVMVVVEVSGFFYQNSESFVYPVTRAEN